MPPQPLSINVASVSLNQIVYDLAHNVKIALTAIDRAADDGATILSFPELSPLTAYGADDYHHWHKTNDDLWPIVMLIAKSAAARDPNLILSIGLPWHYADRSRPADDPEYNRNNRPFNTQFILQGGRVVGIAAKSILADGAAEYEPRQFSNWPISKGTIPITLPDGSTVPFGKPVLAFVDDHGQSMTLAIEMCAEGWVGVHDDGTINEREQNEARHIIAMARDNDLSIVLNPSASKPEPLLQKETLRMNGLCKTGSRYCGVYVYTNVLGSDSGTYAAEGSQIFAQNGDIVHHGPRYSFADFQYARLTVTVPPVTRSMPSATIPYVFREPDIMAPPKIGAESLFDQAFAAGDLSDEELVFEECMRSVALWHRDYIAKPARGTQGVVISLSGGKDSAAGALMVTTMIELEVQENGLDGFFHRFKDLEYEDTIRSIAASEGADAALRELKKRFLTCVYIPTDISSQRTQDAARFLIEGGTLPDGTSVPGIGGTFFVAPVQPVLDEMLASFAGLDLDRIARNHTDALLGAGPGGHFSESERVTLARAALKDRIKAYIVADKADEALLPDFVMTACQMPLPRWCNPADDITLQNIQARVREPIPWTVGNKLRKMPLVTSNASENVLGYTTAGGDMHMGGANGIGGIPKHIITHMLLYLEQRGLRGLSPVRALHAINHEKPTAELRRVTEGTVAQTDENDLGFNYHQSFFMEQRLIIGRQTPHTVLKAMTESPLFPDDAWDNRGILIAFCKRWSSNHFKRIMAPLAPHIGHNVDPHQAVRTTVLGDHFRTACARMTLDIIGDIPGVSRDTAALAASLSAPFRDALYHWPKEKLLDPAVMSGFQSEWAWIDRLRNGQP